MLNEIEAFKTSDRALLVWHYAFYACENVCEIRVKKRNHIESKKNANLLPKSEKT